MTSKPSSSSPITGITLIITSEIFGPIGGIARMAQLYLRAICELSAEKSRGVRLLALNDSAFDPSDTRRYSAENLNDWSACNGNKRRFVREAFRMARGCDRLVCMHVSQLPVAWAVRFLNPRLRYYLVAYGIEVWQPFSFIERLALRGAARIFCISDYTRQELRKNCRLSEGRAVVLPPALDSTVFDINTGAPLAKCGPVILTVSRLVYSDRYKGVEHLIAAMPAVRAVLPAAELRIIGSGNDMPRLQGLSRQLGIFDRGVKFLGSVDDRALGVEMGSCRLFALPSGREGFGIVYLEAMARGRPCLGARAGAAPEVLTSDVGVLVEFGDISGIADACIGALRREWNQEKMLERVQAYAYEAIRDRLGALLAQ